MLNLECKGLSSPEIDKILKQMNKQFSTASKEDIKTLIRTLAATAIIACAPNIDEQLVKQCLNAEVGPDGYEIPENLFSEDYEDIVYAIEIVVRDLHRLPWGDSDVSAREDYVTKCVDRILYAANSFVWNQIGDSSIEEEELQGSHLGYLVPFDKMISSIEEPSFGFLTKTYNAMVYFTLLTIFGQSGSAKTVTGIIKRCEASVSDTEEDTPQRQILALASKLSKCNIKTIGDAIEVNRLYKELVSRIKNYPSALLVPLPLSDLYISVIKTQAFTAGLHTTLSEQDVMDTPAYQRTLTYLLAQNLRKLFPDEDLTEEAFEYPFALFCMVDDTAFQNYHYFLKSLEPLDQTIVHLRQQFLARYNAMLYHFVPEALDTPTKPSKAKDMLLDLAEFTQERVSSDIYDLLKSSKLKDINGIIDFWTWAERCSEFDSVSAVQNYYKFAVALLQGKIEEAGLPPEITTNVTKLCKSAGISKSDGIQYYAAELKRMYDVAMDIEYSLGGGVITTSHAMEICGLIVWTLLKTPIAPDETTHTSHFNA